ncbi:MAG: NAD(P)/FAD-dependent oxidoreductase [Burkholderiaceae bacterium]
MTEAESFDAIVLGAGGAGLMCAGVAGQLGRRVLVVDHNDAPGRKILISGGGRCNFTNLETRPDRFLSANRHFAKSALGRFGAAHFIAMVDRHRIAWHEKTLGQLFCDGSARQIVKMLLDECPPDRVSLALGEPVTELEHGVSGFRLRFGARQVTAPALVVATGGPSIPKLGASGFAYDLARRFGVPVIAPHPALVPLWLPESDADFRGLSGVATDVVARVGKVAFREAALFTHRGLSGPAILQVSSYWRPGDEVTLDLIPDLAGDEDIWVRAKAAAPKRALAAELGQHVPARLAEVLLHRLGLAAPLGECRDRDLRRLAQALHGWRFAPADTAGFEKAEVTVGGVDTAALSSKTMATNALPGLYFVGEAVDVTGWLGGYNFQWAWSSGWAAGQALAATATGG